MLTKHKLFLKALLTLFITSSAFAEVEMPKMIDGTPTAADLEADRARDLEAFRPMAEELGITAEEFIERDRIIMKVTMSLPQTFTEQMEADPAYADSWVQHHPEPMMYITFAGQEGYNRGKALVAKFAADFGGFWVDYVEVRKATISQIELNKLRDKIERILRTDNGIDLRAGNGHDDNSPDAHILVEVMQPVKTVEDILLKAGIKPSRYVKIIQVPEFAVPFSSLYGGFGLKTATSVPLCTSGFAVTV